MSEKRTLLISFVCIFLTTFFGALSGIIPSLSIILIIFASVSAAYCFARCGMVTGIVNAAVSSAVIWALARFDAFVLLLPAMCLIPGIISGVMTKMKTEYYSRLIGVVVGFLGAFVLILYVYGVVSGMGISGIFDSFGGSIKQSISQIINSVDDLSGGSQALNETLSVGTMEGFVDQVIALIKMMLPSMLIVFSMVIGYIHLALLNFVMKKSQVDKSDYVYIDSHCAPRSMTYVYFILSIVAMFSESGEAMYIVLNNVIVILDIIIAFCGLSFIESKFKNKLKIKTLRCIIYVAVILFTGNLAIQILSIIGMFDSFSDYRGIRRLGE